MLFINRFFLFGFLLATLLTSNALFADEAVKVRTQLLADLAVYPEASGPAQTLSLNETPIATQIDAKVIEISVRVGDVVKSKALLVKLNCREFELEHARLIAEKQALLAKLNLIEWQYKQAKILADQQTLPEEQVQDKSSQLAIAKGDLAVKTVQIDSALEKMSQCQVTSPFSGVISARLISEGQTVTRGSPLLKLLDLSKTEVSAQIPVQDIFKLHDAAKWAFEYNNQRFPLSLRRVLPLINPESGTQEVRLDFIGKSAIPGATGRLVWRDKAMHIPAEILVSRGDKFGVFVNEGGKAKFVSLANAQSGRDIETDLSSDTEIVITGQFGLTDGVAITPSLDPKKVGHNK